MEIERAGRTDQSCANACARPYTCPLSCVRAGMQVRIKQLSAPDDVNKRLREIGFVEQQVIKLLISQTNLICQVCNTRLALSAELARLIIVEPVAAPVLSR
jgi:Fe2+ transport system protein FeoA